MFAFLKVLVDCVVDNCIIVLGPNDEVLCADLIGG